MEDLVNSLMKMTPEESEAWILQMAQHTPPPNAAKPVKAPMVTDQIIQGATIPQVGMPPVNMGQIVNPTPVAPGYVAPQAMASLSPEQLRSLSTQGERAPVPKMPVPSAPGVHSPGQVSVTASQMGQGQRAPVAPRLSLAQILGR